jgi:hypothetical protein
VSEFSKCLHECIVPFLDTGDYAILAAKLEAEEAELETGTQAKQLNFFVSSGLSYHLCSQDACFIILRIAGCGQENVVQTSAQDALCILKEESNILVACTFQNGQDFDSDIELFTSYFSRMGLLPPSFSTSFLLLSNTLTSPRLNLCSIEKQGALSKREQLDKVLNRLNCSRICCCEGSIVREESNSTKIACAFGFRARNVPSTSENVSLVHILPYRVRTLNSVYLAAA